MKGMGIPAIFAVVVVFTVLRGLDPFAAGTTGATAWSLSLDGVLVLALFAAVRGFDRDDPPRRGWMCTALAQLGIWVGHAFQAADIPHQPVIVVANGLWIVAIVLWIRTFGGSALAPAWTRKARIGVAVPVLVALATAGAGVFLELQGQADAPVGARKETWDVAYALASTIADAAVFIGAVFLVRVLFPMSGGGFARPYLLLCISAAIYLGLDLSLVITGLGSFAAFDGVLSWVSALADGTSLGAGVAQAALLHRASGRA